MLGTRKPARHHLHTTSFVSCIQSLQPLKAFEMLFFPQYHIARRVTLQK